jgi:hypothetical protein
MCSRTYSAAYQRQKQLMVSVIQVTMRTNAVAHAPAHRPSHMCPVACRVIDSNSCCCSDTQESTVILRLRMHDKLHLITRFTRPTHRPIRRGRDHQHIPASPPQ